jgi:uncharacterized protein (DUF2147 family)
MIIRTLMLTALMFSTAALAAEPILGKWKQIDDRTGQVRSVVVMAQEPDGSISGTVIKRYPYPGMKELCQNCPPPYTNQPIEGMKPITGLRPDPDRPGQYVQGQIIDPNTGKVYRMKAKVNANGRTMTGRGYLGVSLLGRSQTWLRADD